MKNRGQVSEVSCRLFVSAAPVVLSAWLLRLLRRLLQSVYSVCVRMFLAARSAGKLTAAVDHAYAMAESARVWAERASSIVDVPCSVIGLKGLGCGALCHPYPSFAPIGVRAVLCAAKVCWRLLSISRLRAQSRLIKKQRLVLAVGIRHGNCIFRNWRNWLGRSTRIYPNDRNSREICYSYFDHGWGRLAGFMFPHFAEELRSTLRCLAAPNLDSPTVVLLTCLKIDYIYQY